MDDIDFKNDTSLLIGPEHKGMRISASGMLGRISRNGRVSKFDRWLVGELLGHMKEMGKRYYSGDVLAVDEFLQLYCCDDDRPKGKEV